MQFHSNTSLLKEVQGPHRTNQWVKYIKIVTIVIYIVLKLITWNVTKSRHARHGFITLLSGCSGIFGVAEDHIRTDLSRFSWAPPKHKLNQRTTMLHPSVSHSLGPTPQEEALPHLTWTRVSPPTSLHLLKNSKPLQKKVSWRLAREPTRTSYKRRRPLAQTAIHIRIWASPIASWVCPPSCWASELQFASKIWKN